MLVQPGNSITGTVMAERPLTCRLQAVRFNVIRIRTGVNGIPVLNPVAVGIVFVTLKPVNSGRSFEAMECINHAQENGQSTEPCYDLVPC